MFVKITKFAANKTIFNLLQGKNILVADDNRINQKILIFILEKIGITVTTALNGAEAVEIVKNNPIDLVLMDIQMPKMDGLEATVEIRNTLKNNIPIVGLTANTLDGEKIRCLEAGMNTCVSKPFDPVALVQLISELLQN